MLLIRFVVAVTAAVMAFPPTLFAETFTVSKDGRGQFASIQAAINTAQMQDEVVVLDSAVYAEQVTIDSTKSGLVLRSAKPANLKKPTILFLDIINVGPTTVAEALVDSLITFDRNGALRILGAANVRIEGIAVDGGGVYPFGYDAIWEGRNALQSGNAALTIWKSCEVIISNCDISNSYYGINVKDRIEGGIYVHSNPADIDTQNIPQNFGFARTGNHLIEYNRVYNNSYGFHFESAGDMGSTVRYNLIYENHHPTAAIATKVKTLTKEGGNQSGGAFIFIDYLLSPLAIYNNTFRHNSTIFLGNWKAGGQHLVFNNIVAEPNEYWGVSTTTFCTSFDMSKCFANRMHSCVYAAQQQAPTPNYTTITNDLKPARAPTSRAPRYRHSLRRQRCTGSKQNFCRLIRLTLSFSSPIGAIR